MLENFTNMIDVPDVEMDFIDEGDVEPYNKIKDELLAKRDSMICPFCKENMENKPNHIKEFHLEEIKSVLRNIDRKEYLKLKKELILDNLK